MKLNEKELNDINGGGLSLSAAKWMIIGGIATFVIGFLGGITRPLTCSSGK